MKNRPYRRLNKNRADAIAKFFHDRERHVEENWQAELDSRGDPSIKPGECPYIDDGIQHHSDSIDDTGDWMIDSSEAFRLD